MTVRTLRETDRQSVSQSRGHTVGHDGKNFLKDKQTAKQLDMIRETVSKQES